MLKNNKKAILVVSFGTTYKQTRKLTIERIEDCIKDKFKDYEIRRAFTSHIVIKKLKNLCDIFVDNPEEALERLYKDGFSEVVVQPLHIIPGEEYDYISNVVDAYRIKNCFKNITLGRPLLYFKGEDTIPDDYSIMVEALKTQFSDNENVIFMGHGTKHHANAVYSCLQSVLRDYGLNNIFIGTIEGYPTINNIITYLKEKEIKQVTLMPMLLVAGDHVINDMASDEEDSWKSILEKEGFKVKIYFHGLGENPKIQNIYVKHLEDAILNKYIKVQQKKKDGFKGRGCDYELY